MNIHRFYETIGGDYTGTLARLMKEERMEKYLLRFADNTDYPDFFAAWEAQNYADAFRFVHNLKGMCLNLGISPLADIASDVCEELRGGAPKGDISAQLEKLKEVNAKVMEALADCRDA